MTEPYMPRIFKGAGIHFCFDSSTVDKQRGSTSSVVSGTLSILSVCSDTRRARVFATLMDN